VLVFRSRYCRKTEEAQYIKNMQNFIKLGNRHITDIGNTILKDSLWVIFILVASRGLVFLNSLIFAKLLGAKGYGVYVYSITWVGFLSVFAVLGFDKLLMRNISVYYINSEWSLMRGIIIFSHKLVFLISLIIICFAGFINVYWRHLFNPETTDTFLLSLILLPIIALSNLRQSILRALNKIGKSLAPDLLFQPLLILICAILYYLAAPLLKISPLTVVGVTIFATLFSLSIGIVFLIKVLPKKLYKIKKKNDYGLWLKSSLPMLVTGGVAIINSQCDIIMLGIIKGPPMAGIYSVGYSLASLVSFTLMAVNMAIAPSIVSLFYKNDIINLQQKITYSARFILALSIPIAVILIAFGKSILFYFGPEFIFGYSSLVILCIGQIVNAGSGSVGLILEMTNHERESAIGFSIGALINIMLNFVLIPKFDMIGAAIASSTSMVIWNLILSLKVFKEVGIYPTSIGKPSLRKKENGI
jgi:O-antigen/teichoic acid export membrane protein